MSWPFSRKKAHQDRPGRRGPDGLVSGIHRAPGLGLLAEELRRHPPRAVLDLGPSSTNSVALLSTLCDNISILDLFGSVATRSGTRSEIFRFDDDVVGSLPSVGGSFDVVLLWDLLHYFERSGLAALAARVEACCKPGALVHLLVSAVVPVPLTPIRFRFQKWDELVYEIPSDERAACPRLRTRDVESLLSGFEPLRLFQLRNGLQEFLFRRREPSKRELDEAIERETASADRSLLLFD